MMVHFRALRKKLHINSVIIIGHQWRLYARRKAIKAEKKKKKAEALKLKSKKKPGRRTTAAPADPSQTTP
jgi:pSer/pThr/pTyr-binding forkhead associated (FHA) protein